MKVKTLRGVLMAGIAATLGLAAANAWSDVTIVRTMNIEGIGGMSLANTSGTTKTTISGNNSRTDTETKMQSKFIGFLARNALGPTVEIVALDQDRIDHLNVNKKEYTETTFEEMRAQLQKATDQMNSAPAATDQRQPPSAVDQSKCEWLPAKVSVSKTGESGQFAGYDAQRTLITAVQPCQDKESGSICDVVIVLDQWLTPNFSENAEVRKFYTAYAAKMGFDQANLQQDATQRAKVLFAQYKGLWTEVAAKMQGVKGYPVKTGFTLAMGGTQCKDQNAQQTQTSQSDDTSASPTSPGGIAGMMAGKLGGLFHKKQDDSDAAASQPAAAPSVPVPAGDVPLMTVSSQLVSVSTDSVGPDAFAIPAGFKKTEMRTQ